MGVVECEVSYGCLVPSVLPYQPCWEISTILWLNDSGMYDGYSGTFKKGAVCSNFSSYLAVILPLTETSNHTTSCCGLQKSVIE
jgi:hypothetical protein